MHKVLFVDVESTGDGSDINHGLLEIAFEYWVFYPRGHAQQIDTFYTKIKPDNTYVYQQLAGRHGERKFANLKKARKFADMNLPTNKEAYGMLLNWLDKHIRNTDKKDKASLHAFNSPFDKKLLINFFEKNDSNYLHSYIYKTDICIRRLAAEYAGSNRHLFPGERLKDFLRQYEIPFVEEDLHSAHYDCEMARLLYFKVWEKIQKRLNSLVMTTKLKDDDE